MRPEDDHRDERGRQRAGAADAIAEGVRGAGPGEIPARLCDVAVELLPVTGASVSLHSDGMPVQLGASGARAAYVTEIQATLGDGPCQCAAASGVPVFACDLTAGQDVLRWPVFAQEATAVGVRAVYSMPLGNETVCVGTLDLYRDTPGDLTDRDLRTARVVAGMMTVALMALPRVEDAGEPGDERWLSGLATDQDQVYQATGMIMAQLGVGTDEALARLRAHAYAHARTAVDVARDVVEHRLRFDER
ncbi:GAF and ANTAR domain-containing protein [Streptomyces muensis]|uniref:GAF and ANTAR domain-containing protein n=1 Tax=Streptomyces muensis TaxID=1077944 RepID=A0A9X1Q6R0_STRM4|nr:GAF and ANTAR domain-containing protein [Streptomyces muensis]MCF1599013.1 GAF and ANTAR domain-containing protein [Streptomyces muensis]